MTSSTSSPATCIWTMAATSASSPIRRSSCRRPRSRTRFWPKPGTGGPYIIGDVMPLRAPNSNYPNAVKMMQLEGDLDLFGDGTLVVKRWVAHTPGSQMMTVQLKNTGLIILTGDNVYFRENVEKSIPPNIVLAYDPSGFLLAYEWIRSMMATQKADFFTAHDPDAFKAHEEGAGILRLMPAPGRASTDLPRATQTGTRRAASLDTGLAVVPTRSCSSCMAVLSLERLSKRLRRPPGRGCASPSRSTSARCWACSVPTAPVKAPFCGSSPATCADLGECPDRRLRCCRATARRPARAHRLRAGECPALRPHAGRRVPRLHGSAARHERPALERPSTLRSSG